MNKIFLQNFLLVFVLIAISSGQPVYKQSSDCPGNLKWKTNGITVLGGNGYGSKANQLKYADGLFIEPKTQILYIADAGNNRVQKLYPNGQLKTAAGSPNGDGGSTPDKLTSPSGVFADENENVYVADLHNSRIQYWEKNAKVGKTVAGNQTTGSALNEFNSPIRVLLDSKNNLIVVDVQNSRVTQWSLPYDQKTSTGILLAGGHGTGFDYDQLNLPVGIYFDEPNNVLYIANDASHTVTQWYLGAYQPHNVYAGIPGRPGNSPSQLQSPEGINFDKYGNLYIADCMNNRIQMYCPNAVDGITILGTGQIGNGSNQFYFPRDIAFDANMNLYVTDTYNLRIQKFERIQ